MWLGGVARGGEAIGNQEMYRIVGAGEIGGIRKHATRRVAMGSRGFCIGAVARPLGAPYKTKFLLMGSIYSAVYFSATKRIHSASEVLPRNLLCMAAVLQLLLRDSIAIAIIKNLLLGLAAKVLLLYANRLPP